MDSRAAQPSKYVPQDDPCTAQLKKEAKERHAILEEAPKQWLEKFGSAVAGREAEVAPDKGVNPVATVASISTPELDHDCHEYAVYGWLAEQRH